jgi:DNA-binding NarL/FixJ family response regulator
MNPPLRLIVVDDHPMFRRGVVGLLESVADTAVVGQAATGEEAIALATALRPDVVLMDLNLPGMTGVEATREVLRASPDTAVLVLTMVDDDDTVVAALRAGARGYVLKGAGQEELLSAVRAVASHAAVFGEAVAARMLETLLDRRACGPRTVPGLSERESQVLQLMADGLDNARIARELGLSVKTVQNHVSRVLAKLQARDRVDAVLRFREQR